MELTYHWEGDVLIPDLELEDGSNYQIGKAAKETVLLCNIKTYGPYISTLGEDQIDYYFIYGETNEETISMYKKLTL